MREREERIAELFARACDLRREEQQRFLQRECGADRELLRELLELLAHDSETEGPVPADPSREGDQALSFFARRGDRPASRPARAGARAGDEVGGYRLLEPIGHGGMGEVWLAEQPSLARRVALKLVLPERVDEAALALFAREARAGARVSHPWLVSVFDHGEAGGLAWIAMEYVEGGRTLRDFLDEAARAGALPPSYDRDVARFVAEVADAVQAAHDAGVIHRDLKPQNVLVSPRDEPKVTDFGLARIADEPGLSRTGEFAGTYAYASPEQVTGRRAEIDARTDVFGLGVILYEMLALQRPFQGDSGHQIAAQILGKEPPDLRSFRSRIPRDLVVIVGKALAKDRQRRYASMAELAADLRRFLRDEPIFARPPTRRERAVKWARRHPTRSLAGLFVLLALAIGATFVGRELRNQRALAARGQELARLAALQDLQDLIGRADALWPARPERIEEYEEWIEDARALADGLPVHRSKLAQLRALARPRTEEERRAERAGHREHARLEALQREVEMKQGALDARRGSPPADTPLADDASASAWTERAEELFVRGYDEAALDAGYAAVSAAGDEEAADCEAWYGGLEERVALARSPAGLAAAEDELAALRAECAALEREVDARRDWRFPEALEQERWWHNQLEKLIEGLESLADPSTGLLAPEAISPQHGWSVPKRLAFARGLRRDFADGSDHDARWRAALPRIAEAYPGLELAIQVGLVPIGPDPDSGLWEFWHVASGAEPVRDGSGALRPAEGSGIVLVLLPGGSFWMGAQRTDPSAPNFDLEAKEEETPVHQVTLSAFFLSKYEMTQAQWLRANGRNPSHWRPGSEVPGTTLLHPVEQVDWIQAGRALERMDLALPTEAQWEYACRAGTDTPFSCAREELATHANLTDRAYTDVFQIKLVAESWDDGYPATAPIGSFAPNPWGLHDVHGNVWEWCADGYGYASYDLHAAVDPLVPGFESETRVFRGGCFTFGATSARSAYRYADAPTSASDSLGARPARRIDR